MPRAGMSWHRLAHLHKSSLSSITMSSLLYPDSLAPPTSARGVSNPTTTKVSTPVTTTQTTAVPVSRLDVQITPRPDAEVFRRCRPAIYVDLCSMGQRVSPIMCLRHRVGRPRITSNWASVRVVGSAATVANSLWVANSNKNTGVATSRVLCVTITSKPCHIGASFKWLRLPRKNGQNVVPNEDLVIVCVVLLPAWPLCTPTRTMCPLPHCLCLQLGSLSEPHGSWHDHQQTALRLALEHQSFSRGPGVAPLAIVPVTGWRLLHPTCRQFWRVPDSSFSVHGRQIPWENQHCLRVPRLLFQSHRIPPPPRR